MDDNWKVDPMAPCTPAIIDSGSRIELTAVITVPGQTVRVNKHFTNAYMIDWGDGSAVANLTALTGHTYSSAGTYTITLTLTGGATRWTFGYHYASLVPQG